MFIVILSGLVVNTHSRMATLEPTVHSLNIQCSMIAQRDKNSHKSDDRAYTTGYYPHDSLPRYIGTQSASRVPALRVYEGCDSLWIIAF
jgi:hypothetical protein